LINTRLSTQKGWKAELA